MLFTTYTCMYQCAMYMYVSCVTSLPQHCKSNLNKEEPSEGCCYTITVELLQHFKSNLNKEEPSEGCCYTITVELLQHFKSNLNKEEPSEGCRDGCQWIRVTLMVQPLHSTQLYFTIQMVARNTLK